MFQYRVNGRTYTYRLRRQHAPATIRFYRGFKIEIYRLKSDHVCCRYEYKLLPLEVTMGMWKRYKANHKLNRTIRIPATAFYGNDSDRSMSECIWSAQSTINEHYYFNRPRK